MYTLTALVIGLLITVLITAWQLRLAWVQLRALWIAMQDLQSQLRELGSRVCWIESRPVLRAWVPQRRTARCADCGIEVQLISGPGMDGPVHCPGCREELGLLPYDVARDLIDE